jgi:predicted secreted protein
MVAGTDPGAPILPRLVSKLVWTTAISALLFAAIYLATYYRLIGLDDIPGLPRPTL